jgi:hypothetical protein
MPEADVLASDGQAPYGPGADDRPGQSSVRPVPRRQWARRLTVALILAVVGIAVWVVVDRRLAEERYDPLSFSPISTCCDSHPAPSSGSALNPAMQIMVGPGNEGFFAVFEVNNDGRWPVRIDGIGQPQLASLANMIGNPEIRLVDPQTLSAARPTTMPFGHFELPGHQHRYIEIDGHVTGCPVHRNVRTADLSGLTVNWSGRGFGHATWVPLNVSLVLTASTSCAA